MTSYQLRTPVSALIFDMDNTLYTHEAYARHQEQVLVERLAAELLVSTEAAADLVQATRSRLSHARGGKKPSLGTIFLELGVSIATSVIWRNELIRPQDYLQADGQLARTLQRLAHNHSLAVVTNNPVATARRTLDILGVGDLIPIVIGLDSTGVSKPDPAAFRLAVEGLACRPAEVVSVGDRFEIDIEPALELGMGGILVDGVDEVYALPDFLAGRS